MSPELMGTVTVLVAGVIAALIYRLIKKHKSNALMRALKNGSVYTIPPFAAEASILVFILVGAVNLVMFLVKVSLNDISWWQIASINAILVIPVGFMAYTQVVNSGWVVLTEDAIILNQMGKERKLRFIDIHQIKAQNGNPFFSHMVIIGNTKTLRINRRIDYLTHLYNHLLERTNVNRQDKSLQFPVILRIRKSFVWSNAIGFSLIIVMSISLSVVFAMNYPEPLMVLISLFAISAFIISVIVVLFLNHECLLKNPLAYEFTINEIRFYNVGDKWHSWSTKEIETISPCPVTTPIQASFQGVSISENKTQTEIMLHFEDERQLLIPERRCWQFGYSPEELIYILHKLYPHTKN